MFVFPEQKVFNVGGVRVGGQSNVPCVLVGTIFYEGERILDDKSSGGFDRRKAESLVNTLDRLSDETGVPSMVDVYANSSNAMTDRIDFISDVTEMPFMIDSTDVLVRLAGVCHVDEVGLSGRAVYNSINVGVTDVEVASLSESDVDSAVVLAFNPARNNLLGRIGLLEDGGGMMDRGLLDVACDCGVKKPLVDTGVMPLGEGAGSAARSVLAVKSKFGLPTGNGIHNAVSACGWPEEGDLRRIVDASSNALIRLLGADFLMYGPIEAARSVYAAVGWAECLIAEALEEVGLRVGKDHPYRRILR